MTFVGTPSALIRTIAVLSAALLLLLRSSLAVSAEEFNYDESKVPAYTLPELLKSEDGTIISSADQWMSKRRPELLRLFEKYVFGTPPAGKTPVRTRLRSETKHAINGLALRREVTVFFSEDDRGPQMDLLIYTPTDAKGPVPAILGYNFNGNHSIEKDPTLHITDSWVRDNKDTGITNNKANEASRGSEANRWAVEMMMRRGYALITIYYGDVDPDFDDGFRNGIHSLFEKHETPRAADAGGSIAAWAWGLSRAMDVLESDPAIDAGRVAVFGHSRLGKTSLWAGANDPRFALVISNESGCGGAALSKRWYGETVARINTSFPHWFCLNHRQFNNNEQAMPIDHHMLIALSAPRPVYVASAEEDKWADPYGEFLGLYHAGPAWELFGKSPLPSDTMPDVNHPVMEDVAYHVRTGKHDVTDYDWEQYLNFADRHLKSDREAK